MKIKFSPRQNTILTELLWHDKTRKQIAGETGLKLSTVNKHIERARAKAGCQTILQLQKIFLRLS